MSRDEIIARIRKHADAIKAEGATALYLFGSAARDEIEDQSDIDVFVDIDPNSRFSLFNMSGIRLIIRDETGREVDITTRDGLHPRLRDRILAEAVQVIPRVSLPEPSRRARGDGMAKGPRDESVVIDEMIDHIDYIAGKIRDRSLEELGTDRDLRYAVERSLEIISEASRHLGDPYKAREPDIPWRQVADFGNVLRHTYFSVMLDTGPLSASSESESAPASYAGSHFLRKTGVHFSGKCFTWRIVTEELTPLRAALIRLRDAKE